MRPTQRLTRNTHHRTPTNPNPNPITNPKPTQYALWGNKTDLSMLVDASKLDVNASVRITAAGAGAGGHLILDDFEAIWKMLDMRPDGGGGVGFGG